MMYGNRLLRRIFESEREEVIQRWRKLSTDVLHNMNGEITEKRSCTDVSGKALA
jgi:hypothetical protein